MELVGGRGRRCPLAELLMPIKEVVPETRSYNNNGGVGSRSRVIRGVSTNGFHSINDCISDLGSTALICDMLLLAALPISACPKVAARLPHDRRQ